MHIGLVKISAEAVQAIVAFKACRSIRQAVSRHKGHIDLAVAGITGGWIESGNVIRVTILAGEWNLRRGELVTGQGKPDHLVRKGRVVQLGQAGIRAAMLGVAMTAAKLRIVVQQGPVHRGDIPHLDRDISMAGRAPVRHDLPVPGRGMAGRAISTDLRVGNHATQVLLSVRA